MAASFSANSIDLGLVLPEKLDAKASCSPCILAASSSSVRPCPAITFQRPDAPIRVVDSTRKIFLELVYLQAIVTILIKYTTLRLIIHLDFVIH